jgi:D-glycero-D-manno-heptose 1,7-bisphosphate phosphatase
MMKLVILEREGVIDQDSGVRADSDWQALPGSLDAIARLNRAGYRVAVISQPADDTAPDPSQLQHRQRSLTSALAEAGGVLEGVYFCPHDRWQACDCRLPEPGLFHDLAQRHRAELRGILAIGDGTDFLRAAARAGADPVLVRTGRGEQTLAELGHEAPVMRFSSLARVVDLLLQDPAKQEDAP